MNDFIAMDISSAGITAQRTRLRVIAENLANQHTTGPNGPYQRQETIFESYGRREWTATYQKLAERGTADLLRNEPIIVEEGHYPNGLILIRSGFVRVSQKFGNGHRTRRYLGRGQIFGLEEIVQNWRSSESVPYRHSLRAIGYVAGAEPAGAGSRFPRH